MPKISDEKKKQRQRDILKTALKLFSQKGYYATSIDDITREAGISKGLIYNYFKSKEEIFFELAEHWNEFMNNPSYCINTTMKESWQFIKVDCHSLERYTNFGLCFRNKNTN